MARVIEDTKGHIRCLPIMASLKAILTTAAERAGIATVRVISGGQPAKGEPGRRTGSIRHDHGGAADLKLETATGHILDFEHADERAIIAKFVTECSRLGATGIGAGVTYMGPQTLHVGFGKRATWGAGGKSINAPRWLVEAVRAASQP